MKGCRGGESDTSHSDYCVPSSYTNDPGHSDPVPPTSSVFRLKLYWREGYFWQEETRERKCKLFYENIFYGC